MLVRTIFSYIPLTYLLFLCITFVVSLSLKNIMLYRIIDFFIILRFCFFFKQSLNKWNVLTWFQSLVIFVPGYCNIRTAGSACLGDHIIFRVLRALGTIREHKIWVTVWWLSCRPWSFSWYCNKFNEIPKTIIADEKNNAQLLFNFLRKAQCAQTIFQWLCTSRSNSNVLEFCWVLLKIGIHCKHFIQRHHNDR